MEKNLKAVLIVFFSLFLQLELSASSYSFTPIDNIVDTLPALSTNCPFVENSNDDGYITNEELAVMQFCLGNRLVSVEDISAKILGLWELVGHGEGWIPSISQPCISITISNVDLVVDYEDQYVDTVTTHTWNIIDDINFPYLEVTPPISHGMGIGIICEDYMFTDATPSDGNMYLYQKKQTVNTVDFDLGIKSVRVFPNPSSGIFNLDLFDDSLEMENIQVYDLHGRTVSFRSSFGEKNSVMIDLTDNIQGTYFLVMDFEGKLYRKKLVIL